MADYEVSNKLPAASDQVRPASKEEVSPPLLATHDVVKHTKPSRPLPAAVLVDVETPPPASPVAVLPADDDDDTDDETPPPVADRVLHTVSLWTMVHGLAFVVYIVIAGSTPCNKLTWLLSPCVALTHAAYAEVTALLAAELWCILAVALSALPLLKLLTGTTTTIRRLRGLWWAAAAADVLAWVALAATAGMHGLHIAFDRIYLAADPGERYFFVSVVLVSGCLAVDVVLAGFLLCGRRFPRRLGQGEHQGDDGEV